MDVSSDTDSFEMEMSPEPTTTSDLVISPRGFTIIFTLLEWMKILVEDVVTLASCQRKYLNAEFTKKINSKLCKQNIKCLFQNISNWFKKNESRKADSAHWNGCYKCKICKGTLNMKIIKNPISNNYSPEVVIGIFKNKNQLINFIYLYLKKFFQNATQRTVKSMVYIN